MHTITRRLAVALAAGALLVAAGCAKDETVSTAPTTTPVTASSGGGTTEPDAATDPGEDEDEGSGQYAEACSIIEEIDGYQGDGDLDLAVARFADAREAGPEELAAYWDTLSDRFEELLTLDENSEEAMISALELMDDPEFVEAAAAIDDFAEEECGLDIDLDPSEESPGGLTDDTTDTTDPDEDPTSIDAVQAHLRSLFGTEDWYEVLDENVSWGSSGSSDVSWTISLGSDPTEAGMSESDLLDVCDAMADYLDDVESGDVDITIQDSDEVAFVTRAPGEACEAA